MTDRFPQLSESDLNLKTSLAKQLSNTVIARYDDLPVSRRSMFDLLATHKSGYFVQPRSIIVDYLHYIYSPLPLVERTIFL